MCGLCDHTAAWLGLARDYEVKLKIRPPCVDEPKCETSVLAGGNVQSNRRAAPDSRILHVVRERSGSLQVSQKGDPKWEN